MPQISVIVPVYKVEKYIHRCVDSILNQTFTDFELILVDDGSPDNCGAICDEYAKKDSRVVVIHQENGGLSAARNTGIDWAFVNSNSEWLTFVDSDDWIHPQMLLKLFEANLNNDTNISVCAFCQTTGKEIDIQSSLVCVDSAENLFLRSDVSMVVAWAKLYRKSCFNSIRYPVGRVHEDEFVTHKLLFAEEKISVLTAPYYAYFVNPQGITKSKWNPQKLDIIRAYEEQIAYFKENGYPQIARVIIQTLAVNILKQIKIVKHEENGQYRWPYLYKLYYMRSKILFRCIWNKALDIWLLEYYYPRLMEWCKKFIRPLLRRNKIITNRRA